MTKYGFTLADLVNQQYVFGHEDKPFCNGQHKCYTLHEQKNMLGEASSAFYMTLVGAQLFHLINIKSTHVSIFTHKWSNMTTYFGMALTIGLVGTFIYAPYVQDIMSTYPVGMEGYLPAVGAGILIFLFTEWRRWFLRNGDHNSMLWRRLNW